MVLDPTDQIDQTKTTTFKIDQNSTKYSLEMHRCRENITFAGNFNTKKEDRIILSSSKENLNVSVSASFNLIKRLSMYAISMPFINGRLEISRAVWEQYLHFKKRKRIAKVQSAKKVTTSLTNL